MARKMGPLTILVSALFLMLFPISSGAVPTLGVIDTDLLATPGGTTPVGMDGFLYPSDGGITVWWGKDSPQPWPSSMQNVNIWIVTNQGNTSTFTVGSDVHYLDDPVTVLGGGGGIPGFTGPYFGANLGNIATATDGWSAATLAAAPDLFGGNKQFYLLSGVFDGDGLSPENWIFAVADIRSSDTVPGTLLVYNKTGNPKDDVSPPTTSTTAVPEPSTLLLLGAGLIGFGILGRRKFRS